MPTLSKILLSLLFFAGATFAAFWSGIVPQALSPLSPLSLDKGDQWFVDLRLAALRRDPTLCRSILKQPYVNAIPVADNPPENGCGWANSFEFSEIGGARISVRPLTCEMAAALALWARYELQPAAMAIFGHPVVKIDHLGTYSCRNIEGKNRRSEHASADAIDISDFTLRDGRKISVLHHWRSARLEATFLRRIQRAACRYFRVTLGPEYNAAHADHLHFDRSVFWSCR
ncbi:MAG: extensin family protein [Methyloceanibacter sp.]